MRIKLIHVCGVYHLLVGPLQFFREAADVISPVPIWVAIDEQGYLYSHEWLVGLLYRVAREWRDDKNLVG